MLRRALRLAPIIAIATTLVLGAPVGGPQVGLARADTTGIIAQRGDRSPTVVLLQQLLVNAGITVTGGVDGIYGRGTAAAVTEYQSRRGLTPSGVVDVATATALGMLPATPLLARGAHSNAVTLVQQQLIKVGIPLRGGADGIFGPATEAAVKAFQTAKGLNLTGQVDAATAAILANAAASVPAAVPTPAPPPTSSPVLQRGATGEAVKAFQRELIKVGFRPAGGADGIFGPATATALQRFQHGAGLPVTGIYDPVTAAALTAAATPASGTDGASPSGVNQDGAVVLAAFPVGSTCRFTDTWGAVRSGGRTHQGVDILAPIGTPVYAVQTGTISRKRADFSGSLAGNALWLTVPDGTYFFYAHLSGFADGIVEGSAVRAGDIIGYVGSTGNASIPHLHFEVHPKGGGAVNPYPIVKAVSGC